MEKQPTGQQPETPGQSPFRQTYFHGTRADLAPGDLIETGIASNYGQQKKAKYIYLTATLDAAVWGAELASGTGRERIYLVEATGPLEDDPNVTDKKFPEIPPCRTGRNIPLRWWVRLPPGTGMHRNRL